jgi:hypothetical protein
LPNWQEALRQNRQYLLQTSASWNESPTEKSEKCAKIHSSGPEMFERTVFGFTLNSLCDSLFALARRFDETDLAVKGISISRNLRGAP